jgi:hypothetical protein
MDGTLRLGVKGAKGVLPAVVQAAERGGFDVTDLSITEPTLETVFIDLTGKDLRERPSPRSQSTRSRATTTVSAPPRPSRRCCIATSTC